LTVTEEQYNSIKQNLSQPKRKRGRPTKKGSPTEDDEMQGGNSKLKEYNAQIRKDFKSMNFDAKKMVEEEPSQEYDQDHELDKASDDDDFIDGLKKKHEKEPEINFDKLTKRQRTAHMQKNNLESRGKFAAQENNVDGEAMEQDFSEGLPIRTMKRAPKTNFD